MSHSDVVAASLAATCSVCGQSHPEEFEERLRAILAQDPTLASDPEVEWIFTCGSCSAKGLCPCCKGAQQGAA